MPRTGEARWLTTRPIAHRGLHGADAPENSLPSFEAAVRASYPIELDVHVLRDGTVVVFHDDDLLRATGLPRTLRDETGSSIRKLRLFGTDLGIPTLADVLRLVDGRVPILVELKNRDGRKGMEQAVRDALIEYRGEVAVQSFNPFSMAWFRRHARDIPRGQLAGPLVDDTGLSAFQRFATRRLLGAAWSRPTFINYDLRSLPDPWVDVVIRTSGIPLLCWTVRSEEDQRRAEDMKVNYVFDHVRP